MTNNDDIREEMEQLRKQLDEMKQKSEQSGADSQQRDAKVSAGKPEDDTNSADTASGNDTESGHDTDLAGQFQELMEVLNKEIKDSNPTTLLVVFSLGVLVGRLLPR